MLKCFSKCMACCRFAVWLKLRIKCNKCINFSIWKILLAPFLHADTSWRLCSISVWAISPFATMFSSLFNHNTFIFYDFNVACYRFKGSIAVYVIFLIWTNLWITNMKYLSLYVLRNIRARRLSTRNGDFTKRTYFI